MENSEDSLEGIIRDFENILGRAKKYVNKVPIKKLEQPARNQTSSVQSQVVVKNEPITEPITQANPDGERIVTRTKLGQEPVGALNELVEKLAVTKPEPVYEPLDTQNEPVIDEDTVKALATIEQDGKYYKIMVDVYFAEGDPRNVYKPLNGRLYVSDSYLSRSHEFRRAELEAVYLAMEICRKDRLIIYVEKKFIVRAMRCLHQWLERGWKSKKGYKLEFEDNYKKLLQLKAERDGCGMETYVALSPDISQN